ncbi:hypothetical protein [Xanthocytophaga agilis]|uniref:Glycosyltransferase RgtA/B/C/D-like domain-containing protein n=1 Tax=Xanthocytophaga agilis TaxID=3048010 RepID=A0AAE3R765_9BACT|nr:hypothetical protein [Xanthocytophaga agilis]MDJ1504455.1 hypothetical protein [Xanthocytophaga agilis]
MIFFLRKTFFLTLTEFKGYIILLYKALSIYEKVLIFSIGSLLILLFAIGLMTPPNTWDSMTYHMARVMHWIQNQSVDHYPSHIIRQHYQPPFAEYIILHLQLLSGTDQWANLVQWSFLIGILISVSLLGKELGTNRTTQIVSMFLAITLPLAILEGNSTQNDLVSSFWVLTCVYFILQLRKLSSFVLAAICTGLALSIAVFTKSTSYLWLFPFCFWMGFYLLFIQKQFRYVISLITILLISILLINTGHFYRNHKIYGHILGGTSQERASYVNASHTLPKLTSNVIRNIDLHLRTPFYYWNRSIRLATLKIHHWLGLTMHDPDITYFSSGNLPFYESWRDFDESASGNFFHFLLLIFTCFAFLKYKNDLFSSNRIAYLYLGSCIITFFLFCIYLRWQEWHVRLHLPLFLLFMPLCAIIISQRKAINTSVIIVLLFFALLCILFNNNKPIIPNNYNQYYTIYRKSYKELYNKQSHQYQKIGNYISSLGVNKVGLILGINDGDYLFWIFLQDASKSQITIKHINIENPSKVLESTAFIPDCIISTKNDTDTIIVRNEVYSKVKDIVPAHIYKLIK